MFIIQISSGATGAIREYANVSADGRSAKVSRRFVASEKSYLLGLGRTDVRLRAETFETYDAAQAAIADAREDGVISIDERAVIIIDD